MPSHPSTKLTARDAVSIYLPYPPSANSLWRMVNGRTMLSEPYRKWKRLALQEIALQRPAKVLGPYRLTIMAIRPDQRARDLDNLAKPISDALTASGTITDDSLAQSILIAWSASAPDRNGGVSITLEAA